MKLVSAQINGDGSWDVVVEHHNLNHSVHIPHNVTPMLTSASRIRDYLTAQFPAPSTPTALGDVIGTSW